MQWPLNLEGESRVRVALLGRGQAGRPGKAVGGEREGQGRAPCLGVESGPAKPGLGPGSRIQWAARLGSEVGTSPSEGLCQ